MKLAFAFLTGVLSMAVVVYVTGAHFAAPMFFAGMIAVIAPAVALLSSAQRVRRVALFLNAFCDSIQGVKSITMVPEADPLTADVASALVNQGVPKKAAAAAAAAAAKDNREFAPAFRAALRLLPGKVA